MNKHHPSAVALAVSAILTASVAFSQEPVPPANAGEVQAESPKEFTKPHVSRPSIPVIEEEASVAESRVGNITSAAGTTLNPPVTITYSGNSNAVTINDSGTGRGLSSSLTNSSNSLSAVYGQTQGSGAGVKGINNGTSGSGGVFEVTDAASSQPGLFAATSGTAPAIIAQVTKSNSNAAAIFAENTVSSGYGIGVEGYGNDTGIIGYGATGYGVYGYSTSGYGVYGSSSQAIGVIGTSGSALGVYGYSSSSDGVYGNSSTGDGIYGNSYSGVGVYANSIYSEGLYAHSYGSFAIYAVSDKSYGIWGQSKNQFGVIGEDSGSGIGVYGSSASGYAGYFAGKVGATSFVTLSDRNAKTAFSPVSGSGILERISELPITSWTFKGDSAHRHVGPMAQDFHAAFGLNGDDDKHINLTDIAGVSLAAVQELNKRLKQKDAQIARNDAEITQLKTQIAEMKAMNDQFSARVAKLEQRTSGSAEIMTASLRLRSGAQD
jgi:hypothetical protein